MTFVQIFCTFNVDEIDGSDQSMVCGIVEKATGSNPGPDSNTKVSEVNVTGGGDDCALPHFKLLLISLSIVRYLTCN